MVDTIEPSRDVRIAILESEVIWLKGKLDGVAEMAKHRLDAIERQISGSSLSENSRGGEVSSPHCRESDISSTSSDDGAKPSSPAIPDVMCCDWWQEVSGEITTDPDADRPIRFQADHLGRRVLITEEKLYELLTELASSAYEHGEKRRGINYLWWWNEKKRELGITPEDK